MRSNLSQTITLHLLPSFTMPLLCYILFWSLASLVQSKSITSGVFENVRIQVENLTVTIEFDDVLYPYLKHLNPETIVIANQKISILDTGSISNLAALKNLTLPRNGIRELRRGLFQNVPNLRIVNMSFNEIEEVSFGVFSNLSLTHLYLDHNKIHRIGYKAFSHMALNRLLLNHNSIRRWSKDWLADSFVKILDLRVNFIEELPQFAFSLLSKLPNKKWSVFLSFNQIRKIPRDTFNGFKFYRKIYLDNNLIDRVDPQALRGVEYVNVFNLNNNSLTELSTDLFRTTGIDILMLEDNKLRCISTDAFKMAELDIDGNPITCFCVNTWLDWRSTNSNPSIYHITNLEQDCI